ncbi:MAG: hypothetical protein ACK56I_09790, partial [bacterium]
MIASKVTRIIRCGECVFCKGAACPDKVVDGLDNGVCGWNLADGQVAFQVDRGLQPFEVFGQARIISVGGVGVPAAEVDRQ